MATIDLTNKGAVSGVENCLNSTRLHFVERYVRAADVAALKGSALANGDVIQLVDLPADTYIEGVLLEVTSADTNGAPDVLADIGYTANVDVFIDGASLATAGYAATGTNGDFVANAAIIGTDDTVQLTLGQAVTFASNDDWEIRVVVKFADITSRGRTRSAKDAP